MKPGGTLPAAAAAHPAFTPVELAVGGGPSRFLLGLGVALTRLRRPVRLLHSLIHAPLWSPVPVAMQVPDLSFRRVPGLYPAHTRIRLDWTISHQVRRVRAVTTVSEFSRGEIVSEYGLPEQRVLVIPNAVEPAAPMPPEAAAAARRELGVNAPYLLYVGNLHPRKNVARLVRAFVRAREADPRLAEHRLVLAGALAWRDLELEAALGSAPRGAVCVLGRVDDRARQALLTGAAALAYPSLYEGFGLPPLEAMAAGTPVIAARAGAVPEVVGDAALLFEPTDEDAIGLAIRQVLTDHRLRGRLLERGVGRVRRFSLEAMGRQARRALLAAAALAVMALGVGCGGTAGVTHPSPGRPLPTPSGSVAAGFMAYDSDRSGNYELYLRDLAGRTEARLTNDARYDSWWPRISPDRRYVLFYRTPKGVHDTDFTKTSLWLLAVGGGAPTELRPAQTDGWAQQGHAEWSPSGDALVMFGGSKSNPQIYVTDAGGGGARQITNRGGVSLDPSWSPDGKTIVFIGCPRAICFERDYEVYTMPSSGGEARRLTDDSIRDQDPYFSPDGRRIAWLSETDTHGQAGLSVWNIRVMNGDGSGMRRLTDDRNINSKPQWSPDGSLVYFHRFLPGVSRHWSIYSIRLDGSGLTDVLADLEGNNEFPSV